MANLAIPALLGLASYMTRNKQQGTPAANQTDNTQIMGANQDTEDMEAGQAQNAALAAIPAKPAMQADANQSQAEINRLMNQDANASGVPVSPSIMTQKNPSFKQAFAQARLAGKPTFTWEGKPGVVFTTKYETETTPAKSKPNAPPQVTSVPDQSDAETKRLQAQNTKAVNYKPESAYGGDTGLSMYERGLPKDKNNKIDIDQLINNIKKQDKLENVPRTQDQYDAIRKRVLEKYPDDYIQSSQPKKTSSNRVPTPEEAAANRKAAIDKLASMGKSVSDYVGNFETPAERSSRERKEKMGNAKGGKIKAFAKGGSVSSRGDGIAKKGFTKGRMV
jgi:hypothetical protein